MNSMHGGKGKDNNLKEENVIRENKNNAEREGGRREIKKTIIRKREIDNNKQISMQDKVGEVKKGMKEKEIKENRTNWKKETETTRCMVNTMIKDSYHPIR